MRGASRALAFAVAALSATSAAHAMAPSTPQGAEHQRPWSGWAGLDPSVPSARLPLDKSTVVQLSTPDSERVPFAGGQFVMGSTVGEMSLAVLLCRREVLRSYCDLDRGHVAPLIRSEGVAHDVKVSAFALDRHEVTVASYRRCVSASVCRPPGFAPGDARFDRDDFPVVSVSWDDATTFCHWAGARLPTEAEWELAAKGAHGRMFPWGNVYNSRLANHGSFSIDELDASDGFLQLAPVGSFPDGATPEGVLDLAGNASEWVSDLYDIDEQGFGYPAASAVDPKGSATGIFHAIRGGSYSEGAWELRSTARSWMPEARSSTVGFRCAVDLEPHAPAARASDPASSSAPSPPSPSSSDPSSAATGRKPNRPH